MIHAFQRLKDTLEDNPPSMQISDALALETSPPLIAPDNWLTVTGAAQLLMKDIPGLTIERAKARVSSAARPDRAQFVTNGKGRLERRIEPVSFDAWRLKQRDADLDEEDDKVEPEEDGAADEDPAQ